MLANLPKGGRCSIQGLLRPADHKLHPPDETARTFYDCLGAMFFLYFLVQGLGMREGDTVTDPQYLDQTTANVRGTISADTVHLTSQLDGNLKYCSPAFAFVHHFIVITIT